MINFIFDTKNGLFVCLLTADNLQLFFSPLHHFRASQSESASTAGTNADVTVKTLTRVSVAADASVRSNVCSLHTKAKVWTWHLRPPRRKKLNASKNKTISNELNQRVYTQTRFSKHTHTHTHCSIFRAATADRGNLTLRCLSWTSAACLFSCPHVSDCLLQKHRVKTQKQHEELPSNLTL